MPGVLFLCPTMPVADSAQIRRRWWRVVGTHTQARTGVAQLLTSAVVAGRHACVGHYPREALSCVLVVAGTVRCRVSAEPPKPRVCVCGARASDGTHQAGVDLPEHVKVVEGVPVPRRAGVAAAVAVAASHTRGTRICAVGGCVACGWWRALGRDPSKPSVVRAPRRPKVKKGAAFACLADHAWFLTDDRKMCLPQGLNLGSTGLNRLDESTRSLPCPPNERKQKENNRAIDIESSDIPEIRFGCSVSDDQPPFIGFAGPMPSDGVFPRHRLLLVR